MQETCWGLNGRIQERTSVVAKRERIDLLSDLLSAPPLSNSQYSYGGLGLLQRLGNFANGHASPKLIPTRLDADIQAFVLQVSSQKRPILDDSSFNQLINYILRT